MATEHTAKERIRVADVSGMLLYQGQEVLTGARFDRINKVAVVPLVAADAAGGIVSWVNPEGQAIYIDRLELDLTTVATAACTASFGTTAVSAATSSANLIDSLDVNAATGFFDNITDKGTNGKSRQKLAAGAWVTGSKASGATAGLVGNLFIHYHL